MGDRFLTGLERLIRYRHPVSTKEEQAFDQLGTSRWLFYHTPTGLNDVAETQ